MRTRPKEPSQAEDDALSYVDVNPEIVRLKFALFLVQETNPVKKTNEAFAA